MNLFKIVRYGVAAVLWGGSLWAQSAPTSGSIIQTFAGTEYTWQAEGKPAINASIGLPQDVNTDSAGNIYYVDYFERAYRISPDGNVHLLAGNGFRGDSIDGADARKSPFTEFSGIAPGPDGAVYLGFSLGIKKILADGTLAPVAGGANLSGDGGKAIAAYVGLTNVGFIWDSSGALLFSDMTEHRVRRIDANGIITTIAGNGQNAYGGDGGQATSASISFPRALHLDAAGNLYILESGSGRIRRVTPAGIISTFVSGLVFPDGMDFDRTGNIFVTETPLHRISKITPDGKTRTTFAGTTRGFRDGLAAEAQFNAPQGVKVDADGSVLVADTGNGRIRSITADGRTVSTIAGNGLYASSPDGTPAPQAYFETPQGLAVSPAGNLYISDTSLRGVYRIESGGGLTRVAGSGPNGSVTLTDQSAPARSTALSTPRGIAFDRQGSLYIADFDRIRRVTPDGTMSTVAGGGTAIPAGGPATAADLTSVFDVVADSAGNLFMTQRARVLKVTPDGRISVLAGNGVEGFADGPGAQAQFAALLGIAADTKGNIYVADQGNRRIRKVGPDGTVSTYAGGGFSNPAVATQSDIGVPQGVAVEADGSLLITSHFNANKATLSRVRPDGSLILLVTGSEGFGGDGGPALPARLNTAQGVVADAAGSIYIADRGNFRVRVILSSTPSLSVSPRSLSFTVQSGDPPATPLQVSVTGSTTGLPFSVTTSVPFLTATVTASTIPATVNISADPGALTPGPYTGTVTITPGAAGAAPVNIAVSLSVLPAKPPQLSADTAGLAFSLVRGAAASGKRVLVSNTGGGTLAFTALAVTNNGGAWLSVSPVQASVTANTAASVTVTADPTGLPPNTYTGTVTLSVSGNAAIAIPVTMTVSGSGQLIQLSQAGLTFLSVAGGTTPPPQTLSVVGTGQGALSFTAKPVLPAGAASWLSVTPPGASVTAGQPAILVVSADPTGLAPGDYYGRIEVAAPLADNSPRESTVVLRVLAAGADPGPLVLPSGLVFTGVAGSATLPSQTVTISNLSPGPVRFGSAVATLDGGQYIQYQPASEAVTSSLQLEVQPRVADLAAGAYRGAIVLVFSNGAIRTIGILLVVEPAGTVLSGASFTEESPRSVSGCTPTRLLPQITSLGGNFSVPASFPTPLIAKVVDDCGSPHIQGSVVSTFSDGNPPLAMLSLGDGQWTATWVGSNKSQASATITLTAENPALKIRGTVQFSGTLTGNATPPSVTGGAILSSSSYALQAPLAPAAFVTIFGGLLSNGTAQASTLPLDSQLAGTQVLVAGRFAPLLFSSTGQVNAILPQGTPANAPVQVLVARGDQYSLPVDISVASAAPGIFSTAGNGQGQGHIYVALPTGLKLADSASPAKAGDTLIMYCTGLGPLDSAVPDGGSAPLDRVVNTVNPVTVKIGGSSVPAAFAGLSPGFAVGLYQVNVVVPPGLTPGERVPVVVSVAGQTSPAVTMSIR